VVNAYCVFQKCFCRKDVTEGRNWRWIVRMSGPCFVGYAGARHAYPGECLTRCVQVLMSDL
jgi:hypothetical protein